MKQKISNSVIIQQSYLIIIMMSRHLKTTLKNFPIFRFSQTKANNTNNVINQDIANLLRIDSVRSVHVTKTGHPSSCASIAEIMSVLFFHEAGLKFHATNTKHFLNDRLVLSKGHAAPILYSVLYRAKIISQQMLLSLRLNGSIFQGHPTPKVPFVDVATGSLGQGLSVAAGMSYSSKYFDQISNRIYCITGDGEMAEGNIWEAIDFSSHYKLNNLTLFVDMNSFGQSQQTMNGRHADILAKKFDAFGWSAIIVDGHDIEELVRALTKSKEQKTKPTAIICKTVKGKNLGQSIQDKADWHGKDLGDKTAQAIKHLKSLISTQQTYFTTFPPNGESPILQSKSISITPEYQQNSKISTRKAYGNGLKKARDCNENVVSLDGDTRNSTFSSTFMAKYPNSFIQCFIAEQNMVGVAMGLSCRNKISFCSSFGAFLTRAADQIRVAGIGGNPIKIVGSHAGCSIGQDGPSQMALQDIGFYRSIPNGVVLAPSDGVSTQKAVQLACNYILGPSYIRTSRPQVPILYKNNEPFSLGKSNKYFDIIGKIIYKSQNDKVVIFSHGVMVHESIKVYKQLLQQNIHVRIVDLFCLKPIDQEAVRDCLRDCGGYGVVVEEHYEAGGAYDAICAVAASEINKIIQICVRHIPGSAKPDQQLSNQGLTSKNIKQQIMKLLKL